MTRIRRPVRQKAKPVLSERSDAESSNRMMSDGYNSVHHFFTCEFMNAVHSSATPELSHSRINFICILHL